MEIPTIEIYKAKCTDEKHWENILIAQRCIKCGMHAEEAELVNEAQRPVSEKN